MATEPKTKAKPKGPGGRPEIAITPELLEKTEQLAAQGLNMEQIAHVLGMGKTTLFGKKKEYPEFSNAIEAGRAKGILKISNALFQAAIGGNFAAMKFYLSCRDNGNWRDTVNIEGTLDVNNDASAARQTLRSRLVQVADTGGTE